MYINFNFNDGSNPYVSMTNKKLFEMICKYYLEQTGEKSFDVIGKATIWTVHTGRKMTAYEKNQIHLRDFAINWQHNFSEFNYSWSDLYDWQQFFSEYGRKYGLLREFRENAIC